MPAVVTTPVVPPDVRSPQPLRPAAEIAILAPPKYQSKMIVHRHAGWNPHWRMEGGIGPQLHEDGNVAILMEADVSAVAPMRNVVTAVTDRSTSCM